MPKPTIARIETAWLNSIRTQLIELGAKMKSPTEIVLRDACVTSMFDVCGIQVQVPLNNVLSLNNTPIALEFPVYARIGEEAGSGTTCCPLWKI